MGQAANGEICIGRGSEIQWALALWVATSGDCHVELGTHYFRMPANLHRVGRRGCALGLCFRPGCIINIMQRKSKYRIQHLLRELSDARTRSTCDGGLSAAICVRHPVPGTDQCLLAHPQMGT